MIRKAISKKINARVYALKRRSLQFIDALFLRQHIKIVFLTYRIRSGAFLYVFFDQILLRAPYKGAVWNGQIIYKF